MKKNLRKKVRSRLERMNYQEKTLKESNIVRKFLNSSEYKAAKIIGIYLAFSFEFDTMKIIKQALKDKKTIVVPKTLPHREMIFVKYQPEYLEVSDFGVLEPTNLSEAVLKNEIDLLVVPGVAFNKNGFRIGFGGGFYDKFLADYSGKSVSLVFDAQIIDFVPEQHDYPVNKIFSSEEL